MFLKSSTSDGCIQLHCYFIATTTFEFICLLIWSNLNLCSFPPIYHLAVRWSMYSYCKELIITPVPSTIYRLHLVFWHKGHFATTPLVCSSVHRYTKFSPLSGLLPFAAAQILVPFDIAYLMSLKSSFTKSHWCTKIRTELAGHFSIVVYSAAHSSSQTQFRVLNCSQSNRDKNHNHIQEQIQLSTKCSGFTWKSRTGLRKTA